MSEPQYPDVEKALVKAFDGIAHTCTHLPEDLSDRLPLVQFRRIGGSDSRGNRDDGARVDVLVCADTVDESWSISERIRSRLTQHPIEAGGVVLDYATTETGPNESDYTNPDAMAQHRATYVIHCRRQ